MEFIVSDLHLAPDRPDVLRHFEDWVAGPAAGARALYVLGDLFEAWAGDDDLDDPFNARVAESLARLTNAGTAVYLMHGNRDFLLGEGFLAATGARLLPDPTLIEIAGQPTLLMHGDTLCTDDHAYQSFRAMVRQASWQSAFLAQPLVTRKARIAALRAASESEKSSKPSYIMDVNADAVAAVLRAHGYPRLVHGHTHRPARHWHEVDGRRCERWVLPAWDDGGGGLCCDERGLSAFFLSHRDESV